MTLVTTVNAAVELTSGGTIKNVTDTYYIINRSIYNATTAFTIGSNNVQLECGTGSGCGIVEGRLYVDGVNVPPGDRVTRFNLQKGYVRIASVAHTGRKVMVFWIPPGQAEGSPIPAKFFYHSENDRKTDLPLIERKEN